MSNEASRTSRTMGIWAVALALSIGVAAFLLYGRSKSSGLDPAQERLASPSISEETPRESVNSREPLAAVPQDESATKTPRRELSVLLELAKSALKASKEGDPAKLKQILEDILANPEEVFALIESLTVQGVPEADQDAVLALAKMALRLYAEVPLQAPESGFDAIPYFRRLLALIPALPPRVGSEFLATLGTLKVLDPSFEPDLERCLATESLRRSAAGLLIEIAVQRGAEGSEILKRFLDDKDPGVRDLALGGLMKVDPQQYVAVAQDQFRKNFDPADPGKAVDRAVLIATHAPAKNALDAVVDLVDEKTEPYLTPVFMKLRQRGVAKEAAELFYKTDDAKRRSELLLCLWDDREILEDVQETDSNGRVRGSALVKLSSRFADNATGERIEDALLSAKEEASYSVTAASSFLRSVRTDKAGPVFVSIRQALEKIAANAAYPGWIRQQAQDAVNEYLAAQTK